MPILAPDSENLQWLANVLRQNSVAAIPTETVYGLAANALSSAAVQEVFARKGRPAFNPLIVHVPSAESARQYAALWPDAAQRLAEAFWPGPLTLVVPRGPGIVDEVTAGGSTVALRVPAHPVALELLNLCELPLAAPSANRSNQLSPTRPEHVLTSLGDLPVLDGGPCQVGIESTVVSVLEPRPLILRPGMISALQLESVVGPVATAAAGEGDEPRLSPGQLSRHYSPRGRLQLFSTLIDAHFHSVLLGQGRTVGVIAFYPTGLGHVERVLPDDPDLYARQIFEALHAMDRDGCELILVESVPSTPEWDGIRNRLERASWKPSGTD